MLTPIDETEEEAKRAVREELGKGSSPEDIERRTKEMFGEGSKLADREPAEDDKKQKGCTATHGEDGTISFKYDDEEKE